LLPSLTLTSPDPTPDQNPNTSLLIKDHPEPTKITKKHAASALKSREWLKFEIAIKNPIICIKEHPGSIDYLTANLGDSILIKNSQNFCPGRILSGKNSVSVQKTCEELDLTQQDLMIVDTYRIDISKLAISRQKLYKGEIWSQHIAHPFNLNIQYETPLFGEELEILFGTEDEKSWDYQKQDNLFLQIDPIIIIFGNLEWNFMMKSILYNIAYDDGNDSSFIMNYEKIRQETESSGGGLSMLVKINIENIAMIVMDNP
jgi:hypothetical protein